MTLKTPLEMLYANVKNSPDSIYLNQPNNGVIKPYSWRLFDDYARRVATGLQKLNLPKGSHIGLISKNCAEWFIADIAIMLAGHVSIPIYPSAGKSTIQYVIEHSGCEVIFVGKLENGDEQIKAIHPKLTTIGFPYPGPATTLNWEEMLANEPFKQSPIPDLESTMTIVYTSGSTGNPKGVVHTYDIVSNAAASGVSAMDMTNKDRMMSYLPLAHIVERVLVQQMSIYSGMQVSFLESVETFNNDIRAAAPTIFLSVPRLWTKFQLGVLEKLPKKKLDLLLKIPLLKNIVAKKIKTQLGLADTRLCFCGTAPISPSIMKWFNRLGINISEGWGMTENCAYGTNSIPFNINKIGSIGKAYNGVELRISEEGEIQVKGSTNMKEYYLEPEQTANAFTDDGFLKTGDKGVIDSDGYVSITGRLKDIFKTSKGKYITPAPIESKLSENVYIEQTCVTGTNLKQPIALVVLSELAIKMDKTDILASLEETLKNVNANLEHHSLLDHIVVINEEWSVENDLLTPTLKVKRHVLEDKYKTVIEQSYNEPVIWC